MPDVPPTDLLLAWREDDTDLRIARMLDATGLTPPFEPEVVVSGR